MHPQTTRRARKPPTLGVFSCSTPFRTRGGGGFRARRRSTHVGHENHPRWTVFVLSAVPHTTRMKAHPRGVAFALGAVPHTPGAKTTFLGCVLELDAVPHTTSMKTHQRRCVFMLGAVPYTSGANPPLLGVFLCSSPIRI